MTKPVQIVGIKLDETYRVNEFKSGLFYEKYYPGTTNFGEQKIPGYGLDAQRLELAPRLEEQGQPDFVSQAFHATGPGPVCAARADPERVGQVAPRGIARREEEAALAGNNYGWVGNYHSVPPREGMSLDELAAAWWGKSYPPRSWGRICVPSESRMARTIASVIAASRCRSRSSLFRFGGSIKDATGMPSKLFHYVDDSRTGVYDIDSMSVYIDYDVAQKVLLMDEQTMSAGGGGRQVSAADDAGADQAQARRQAAGGLDHVAHIWDRIYDKYINSEPYPDLLNHVKVQTWEQKQARFIAAVEKEQCW